VIKHNVKSYFRILETIIIIIMITIIINQGHSMEWII